jgi:hypothetical protein
MNDQPRRTPDNVEGEQRLEKELAEVRTQEDKIESELEHVRQEEEKIEKELKKEHRRHHSKKPFFLIFIINGEDFKVKTHVEDFLSAAVEKALVESGNTGRRDPSEWEVRDSAGVLLEMAREIKALGLEDGARLFLSLKVGAGGNNASRS